MKKWLHVCLSVLLLSALSIGTAYKVDAASQEKTYRNCKELNKDYKGGVARTDSTKNKGGKTKYKPHVSQELYDANKKSDRKKDGIACAK